VVFSAADPGYIVTLETFDEGGGGDTRAVFATLTNSTLSELV
jgi:hypothetical protein